MKGHPRQSQTEDSRIRRGLRSILRCRSICDYALLALLDRWQVRRRLGRELTPAESAAWFRDHAGRGARRIRLEAEIVAGQPPERGLLLSNHLSYLDILLHATLAPTIFVAKREIGRWPLFGNVAKAAGTIFLDRTTRTDLLRVEREMDRVLQEPCVVCLFPEGHTSTGETILPFRSSLLAAVAGTDRPVTVAAIDYRLPDGGDPRREAAWTGESNFFLHGLRLLRHRVIQARVAFGETSPCPHDRHAAAREYHAEALRLLDRIRAG